METRGEKRAAFAHGRLGAADGTHGMDFAAAGWLPEVFGQAGLGFGTRKGSMKNFRENWNQDKGNPLPKERTCRFVDTCRVCTLWLVLHQKDSKSKSHADF